MAYLSREFWRPDEERVVGNLTPYSTAVGSAAAGGGPGVASAGAQPSDSGSGEPGALRAFFAANKDQGERILGGLAEGINQRIANTQSGLQTIQNYGPDVPFVPAGGPKEIQGLKDQWNAQAAAYNEANQKAKAAGAETAGQNQAAAAGLATDVNRLGTSEGQQSLLEQQYGSGNYTPGQARLDAWLTGAAQNANPAIVGGVQQSYSGLQGQAGVQPTQNLDTARQSWEQARPKNVLREWMLRMNNG